MNKTGLSLTHGRRSRGGGTGGTCPPNNFGEGDANVFVPPIIIASACLQDYRFLQLFFNC